jgi:hypothetical protein
MSAPIDKDDERWLDALAGKPDLDARDPVGVEALALRKALHARAQRLDAVVPPADDALLEQLRFRLRRERLTGKRTVFRSPTAWALAASVVIGIGLGVRIVVIEDRQPDPSVAELPGIPPTPAETEPAVPKALTTATLVAAADPEAKAKELIHGMPIKALARRQGPSGVGTVVGSTAGSWLDRFSWNDAKRSFEALSGLFREQVQSGVPVVIELGQDQIMLVVHATDAMLEYLRSQDIEPTVTDGEIVILIHTEDAQTPPSIRP